MKRTHVVGRSLVAASKLGCAGAFLCLASSLGALAGCSDNSSGTQPVADGSTPPAEGGTPVADAAGEAEAGNPGPAPIGDPVASCGNCPLCGGALASATQGVSYCSQNCVTDADCPTGTACVTDPVSPQLSKECLKTCHSNTDCVGIFVCRSDVEDAGSVCWSPYPPPVAPEAGAGGVDSGGADAAPDAGPGPGSDAATDAGSTGPDASDSGGPG